MIITSGINLKRRHTFGFDVYANQFIRAFSATELQDLPDDVLILGGGSNCLFTQDIERPVCSYVGDQIKRIDETDTEVLLEVEAGANWHQFVLWCINNNYGGIENLSLIPGNVGAAPMQNIGAYGVEIKSVIELVKGLDLRSKQLVEFTNEACQFGYRSSIFKKEFKHIFITSIIVRLTKNNHIYHIGYKPLQSIFSDAKDLSLRAISDAIIQIRQSKLPDPKVLGNAGSFFKNPIVESSVVDRIVANHPTMPFYEANDGKLKLSAGWLIDQCGWKGKRYKGVGVHEKHALVLVNYNGKSGIEIVELANDIQSSVEDRFGITLVPEVNIY